MWLADPASSGRREERPDARGIIVGNRAQGIAAGPFGGSGDLRPSPTNGYWSAADWLGCRDGKWRPVEPGTFPLAHGAPARVGRLRAYGNAINAEAARAFIECVMEAA
jgi:DNA (cytosine-5)-methyltransferase 1